jgi:hypothetical protein
MMSYKRIVMNKIATFGKNSPGKTKYVQICVDCNLIGYLLNRAQTHCIDKPGKLYLLSCYVFPLDWSTPF